MRYAKNVFTQISKLTNNLIELSLCNDQNMPVKYPNVKGWDTCQILIPSSELSIALKNVEYKEMYIAMSEKRNYNFRLIDGALIVLNYDFIGGEIIRHTLGYYPNPDLLSFQENEEIYYEDDIYSDIVDRRIVMVPLRFDFDSRTDVNKDVDHPMSHLTLGEFKKCRIPVSRPLMPCQFVHFILRNFYNTAYVKYQGKIYNDDTKFNVTISENEKKLVFVDA